MDQYKQWLEKFNQETKNLFDQLIVKFPEGGQYNLSKAMSGKSRSHFLPQNNSWIKASQTYRYSTSNLLDSIRRDLENGVTAFFIYNSFYTEEQILKVLTLFNNSKDVKNLEVYFLDKLSFKLSTKFEFKLSLWEEAMSAREEYFQGATDVEELGLILIKLLKSIETKKQTTIYFHLNTKVFYNIAKIRALKLVLKKVEEQLNSKLDFSLVGLVSLRNWSLYESENNILRNSFSVLSGLLGGLDAVQSVGALHLQEWECSQGIKSSDWEQSQRTSGLTTQVLALEGMLNTTEDPAYGSYALEDLTYHIAQEIWEFMQKNWEISSFKNLFESNLIKFKQEFNLRKLSLVGLNEFADTKECEGNLSEPQSFFYRHGYEFERLKFKKNKRVNRDIRLVICTEASGFYEELSFVENLFDLLDYQIQTHKLTLREITQMSFKPNDVLVFILDSSWIEKIQKLEIFDKHPGIKLIYGKDIVRGLDIMAFHQNLYYQLYGEKDE